MMSFNKVVGLVELLMRSQPRSRTVCVVHLNEKFRYGGGDEDQLLLI